MSKTDYARKTSKSLTPRFSSSGVKTPTTYQRIMEIRQTAVWSGKRFTADFKREAFVPPTAEEVRKKRRLALIKKALKKDGPVVGTNPVGVVLDEFEPLSAKQRYVPLADRGEVQVEVLPPAENRKPYNPMRIKQPSLKGKMR